MEPKPDAAHNVVNSRLRFVDVLVKAGRFGDAIREITEIKQVEPSNPYVQAYEERLKSIRPLEKVRQEKAPANALGQTSPELTAPASPGIAHDVTTQELEDRVTEKIDDSLISAERQQPLVQDSSVGIRALHDCQTRGRATILLVDDDELMLMALVELLEDNKYTTKSFGRSDDALEYVKGHRPDLVLCDVNLENSSFGGFTLHEKMTKLGHLHNVPFIFMSGLVDDAIIRAGKELGADDYLTKPIEPDMLLSVIKGKLRKYKFIEKNH